MADVLNIGTSALLSLQRAISTTGQNIANVNTEGYSRQQVQFSAREPINAGVGFIGSGVEISSITRSFNEFLAADVRDRTSSATGASTLADLTSRIDGILANPDTGLGPALDAFFASVQDVANNPGSIPERQVLLGQAEALVDRFQYLDTQFRSLNREANQRIEGSVQQINALATSLADINDQVVLANTTGNSPNDLLDTRNQLLTRLSELVGVTAVEQGDGAVNVFVGSGQSLVVGGSVTELVAFTDPDDVSRVNVGAAGLSQPQDIGRFISGGELGATLTFRTEVLDVSAGQLGVVAAGVTQTFNEQQALGLDLNGDLGGAFFASLEPGVSARRDNTGSATVSAAYTDVGELTGANYRLRFDGTDYTLTNLATNASQVGPGPTFAVDGFELSVSGAAANGDTFLISPVEQASSRVALTMSDPRLFAAASPLRSDASLANAGSGALNAVEVSDAAGIPLASTVTLTFDPDALGAGLPGFNVTGGPGGTIAFDPDVDSNGIEASLGSVTFRIEGRPEAGDTFTIQNNFDGSGDNRNALALAELQRETPLLGGNASFQDVYAGLVANIAVRGSQAQSAAETEQSLLGQAIAQRDSVQGVNLDEEAANLLRFQQAYQAAAQVISVADQMFQTLLNATSR